VSNIISVIHCLLSILKKESEMMPRETKTSQKNLLFLGVVIGLKPLQTDLVNIVWLINLTSLIPVILVVLDAWYHFSSIRQNLRTILA
jgi:hypothetical protein